MNKSDIMKAAELAKIKRDNCEYADHSEFELLEALIAAAELLKYVEWQPIESAPRDGSYVQMIYYSEHGHSYNELIVSTFYWNEDIWCSWDSECFFEDDYFIGWQPRPQPPVTIEKEGV